MTRLDPLEVRQARYERLRQRVKPVDDDGKPLDDGMSMEAAGALETPALSRARVSAILAKPPAPAGRPPVVVDRDNLQARLRYWERRKTQTTDAGRLEEIEAEIAGLQSQLEAVPA